MLAVGAPSYWMNDPAPVDPPRLRRLPLLLASVCFAAGELLARNLQPTRLLALFAGVLLLLTVLALRRAHRVAPLPAFAFVILTGCWCAQVQPSTDQQLPLRAYADGLSRTVRGNVTRIRNLPAADPSPETQQLPTWEIEPGGWEPDTTPPRQSIDLDVTQIEYLTPDISTLIPMHGGVRVLLIGDPLPLRCGDLLELPLRLRVPDVYRDPGADSYGTELLREGIGVTASAKSAKVTALGPAAPTFTCRLHAAQAWAAQRLDTLIESSANRSLPATFRLSHDDASMLGAMLFGDRTRLTHNLRDAFQTTGTYHVFVVSGLHVVLLAAGLLWILRRVRVPDGLAVAIVIPATAAYALLTGFGVPAQRALLMTSLYLLAGWIDREITPLNALGFAALIVLSIDPSALFEASFQMTFFIVLAIAGIAAPLIRRWPGPYLRATYSLEIIYLDAALHPNLAQFRVCLRMLNKLIAKLLTPHLRSAFSLAVRLMLISAEAVIVSLVAELCMVLPMAVYFHRVPLLALPINLVNIPLLSVVLTVSVITFCASLVSAWIATLPASITAAVLHFMRFTVNHLQHAPLAELRVPGPVPLAIALATLMVFLGCLLLRVRSRVVFRLGIFLVALVPMLVTFPTPPRLHPGLLELTALDVGQGDSLLLVAPNGHTMLIDAGGPVGRSGPSASGWDIGEQVVAPYLWSRHIRRIDTLVLTHAHSDHMGGMPAILRDLRPGELWLSIEPADSPGLRALLAEARRLHIPVRHFHAGESLQWFGLPVTVLAPEAGYANPGAPGNDDSLVLHLGFGRSSILLEGDAQLRSEDTMLRLHRLAPVTLLKVGHHGSKTSTNPEFLGAVMPQEAIISVGLHNTFGHPRAEVLARLESHHIRTFRTDFFGITTFLLTPDGRISSQSTASE